MTLRLRSSKTRLVDKREGHCRKRKPRRSTDALPCENFMKFDGKITGSPDLKFIESVNRSGELKHLPP
jgi:hypothetical protein